MSFGLQNYSGLGVRSDALGRKAQLYVFKLDHLAPATFLI
jgi:hypothetical protein